MGELPIYMLDLATRLAIDKLAYDDATFDRTTLEAKAFAAFFEDLMQELEFREDELKDEDHSLELLMFKRDINAITSVIKSCEFTLNIATDEAEKQLTFVKYNMALRYRYALGLYDTDETFSHYYGRKTDRYENIKEKITCEFTLPTLAIDLDEVVDESRHEYVDVLLATAEKLTEHGERFEDAYHEIKYQLARIYLPSKGNWHEDEPGWRFGYQEQRAIQAEMIMHLKNDLRDAYLINAPWSIQKILTALNIIYYVNLKVSGYNVDVTPADLPEIDYLDASYITTGVLGASMYQASQTYAENVRMYGPKGHGIAAELANHLIDQAFRKEAVLVGSDNSKHGPDRIVNGELIQTKYCATGGKAISECFENGLFKYVDPATGKPMQIEVPKDKYHEALQSLRDRIKRGDMKNLGITNPDDAAKIVRKGKVSYKTAKRIAKAGTIEGITYDAAKGIVSGIPLFGVSATISFASSIWRGEDVDDALDQALKDTADIFGKHLAQYVLTQQVGRTSIEKSLRPATNFVVKKVLGSKTAAKIVNTFLRDASQKALSGAAAANHLAKVLRGNIVSFAITTAVLSSGSIYDAINGRISKMQLVKNVSTTSASAGGMLLGAKIGTAFPVPFVGTVLGGIAGGIIGGTVSKKALDKVIDDDSIQTLETLKRVFVENIEELQLDRDELNYLVRKIFNEKTLAKELKLIFAAVNQEKYIEQKMEPYIEAILKARPKIKDLNNLLENYVQTVEVNGT